MKLSGDGFKLDRVVIETTGLADPAPILFSILMDPRSYEPLLRGGRGVLLDAQGRMANCTCRNHPESVKQIVTADTVIITKDGPCGESDWCRRCASRLRQLNPAASSCMEAARWGD